MKKFDFIIQSIFMLIALYLLFQSIVDKAVLMFFPFLQFFTGAWQLLSAFILSLALNNKQYSRVIKHYWISVVIYFLMLFAGIYNMYESKIFFSIIFYSAWIIALYYYYHTYKKAFEKQNKHTFLDILN